MRSYTTRNGTTPLVKATVRSAQCAILIYFKPCVLVRLIYAQRKNEDIERSIEQDIERSAQQDIFELATYNN